MVASRWTRRDLLRASLLGGSALAAPRLLSGCATLGFGNTLEEARSAGTIRAGIAGEVPYSFADDQGRLTGAVGDLHRAIFARIGDIDVQPVQVPFGNLLDGLDAGNFDVVAAGMFINAARCDQALYSEPVYCAPSALLVAQGNPRGLRDFASLARTGASVAVLGGAVEADYAREAGVDSQLVRPVATQTAGLRAVASGRVDAFALTSISLRSLLERARSRAEGTDLPGVEPGTAAVDRVQLLDPFVPVIDGRRLLGCGGAAFRSNDAELRDAFSAELAAMRDEGTLREILRPWGFTRAELPPRDLTVARLCATGGVGGSDYDPVPR